MKWLRVLALWLLFAGLAYAQIGGMFPGPGTPHTTGAAYTGPIDINGAAYAFWSTRCGSTSYTGNVIDIVDASTGTTTGTRLQCSSGGVISALVSGSACTFVTGNGCSALATTCASACVAKTIYDQSGNTNCTTACNLVSPSLAASPAITTSCSNSKICLAFVNPAGTVCMNSANTTTGTAQSFTLSMVSNNTSNLNFVNAWGYSNSVAFGTVGTNTGWQFAGNTASITMAENAIHASQALYNGVSSSWYLDGTANAGLNAGGSSIGTGAGLAIGDLSPCTARSAPWEGQWFETGVWAGDKTANNSTMNSNQHTYWAF